MRGDGRKAKEREGGDSGDRWCGLTEEVKTTEREWKIMRKEGI